MCVTYRSSQRVSLVVFLKLCSQLPFKQELLDLYSSEFDYSGKF